MLEVVNYESWKAGARVKYSAHNSSKMTMRTNRGERAVWTQSRASHASYLSWWCFNCQDISFSVMNRWVEGQNGTGVFHRDNDNAMVLVVVNFNLGR